MSTRESIARWIAGYPETHAETIADRDEWASRALAAERQVEIRAQDSIATRLARKVGSEAEAVERKIRAADQRAEMWKQRALAAEGSLADVRRALASREGEA